jgi:SAM-dependent methyltransferase
VSADDATSLTPPSNLICTSEEHLYKGRLWVEYFETVCGLRADERVLDIGSGGGRVAVPLSAYLTEGTYEGFDTSAADVEWCRQNISPRAPNFNFGHVDIYNLTYNPGGTIDPAEFKFPYGDSKFDFAYLTSIFTHMLPEHVEHYFEEIARVLRPDGRWLATWFLLDDAALAAIENGTSAYPFKHDLGDYRVVDPERHEDALAYPERHVLDLYERFGMEVSIDLGQWAGRPPSPTNNDGQDIVVARPRS